MTDAGQSDPTMPSVPGSTLAASPSPTLALPHTLASDRHPAAVYLARLAPGSRRTMTAALHTVAGVLSGGLLDAQTLDWGAVRYQHSAALRSHLAEKYAPATANKMLAALRGVLQEAWRLGHMEAEVYHRAAHVGTVRGSSLPPGRALHAGELRALFSICAEDKRPAGVRDAALLGVLYGVGLRRAEVVALTVSDWDAAQRSLRVQRGKGRKARLCYPPAGAEAALQAWLSLRGLVAGPLFVPIRKNGTLEVRAMTDQAVLYILQRRATQAGVAAFSPHDMRRTFISDLLDIGADIATVQSLAGHANVQTTARYDRRGEATRRRAAEMLHVPYVGIPRQEI
jgi:site-specific recombinase XerD